MHSVSLSMKLNIPKFQCSFTLCTTACIVGGVTSRSLSQVFMNFNNKTRLTQSVNIESAVIVESSYYKCEMVDYYNQLNAYEDDIYLIICFIT